MRHPLGSSRKVRAGKHESTRQARVHASRRRRAATACDYGASSPTAVGGSHAISRNRPSPGECSEWIFLSRAMGARRELRAPKPRRSERVRPLRAGRKRQGVHAHADRRSVLRAGADRPTRFVFVRTRMPAVSARGAHYHRPCQRGCTSSFERLSPTICRPVESKFAGLSQVSSAAFRSGHSISRSENTAVSRLRPFTIMCRRRTPSTLNPTLSAARAEAWLATSVRHSQRRQPR